MTNNFKWLTKDGKKFELCELSDKEIQEVEAKAKKDHDILMTECIERAENMFKGISFDSSNAIKIAITLFNSEVSHTSFYKDELWMKKQKEFKEEIK